jgi:hypothetical protein
MVKEMIADTIASALPEGWMPKRASDFLVNLTGNFVVGGPTGPQASPAARSSSIPWRMRPTAAEHFPAKT